MTDEMIEPTRAKEDPERLALRGKPRAAIRLRRSVIVGAAGLVLAGVAAASWVALEPPSFRLAAGDETGRPARAPNADVLGNAPSAYSEIPRLGPPLPGDLGRSILAHERAGQPQFGPSAREGESLELERERAAAAEIERRKGEERSARSSAVLFQLSRAQAERPVLDTSSGASAGAVDASSDQQRSRAGQQEKIDFAGASEGKPEAGRPASGARLSAGTIIPASLITGLNSDLPGMVVAQVTENVRDSATGRTVLIPQGARLLGRYDSQVSFGQKRALLIWQRIVFPDASSVALDKVPATDASGFAGLEDRVSFHEGRLAKGILLSTMFGVGSELALGQGDAALVRALRESTQQRAAEAGETIVERNLDVQPTLVVRPGWPVRALLSEDLILEPWRE